MHGQHRKQRIRIVFFAILVFFIIVVASSLLSVYLHRVKNAVLYDEPGKMVATAQKLYKKGRLDEAVEQLAFYCQYYAQEDAADCFLELGDWYTQKGDSEKAAYAYNRALALQNPELKRANVTQTNGAPFRFQLKPLIGFTKNVHLIVGGESLISMKNSVRGRITSSGKLFQSDDYRTSNWFFTPANMHTLLLTGEFNCAIWEFQNGNGLSTVIESGEIDLAGKSYVLVEIPTDAVKCRVTYRCAQDDEFEDGNAFVYCADQLNDFGGSWFSLISLPDLRENQFILYGDGEWTFWENNQLVSKLDLSSIPFEDTQVISVLSDVCGEVSITVEPEENADIYVSVNLTVLNKPYENSPNGITAANVQNGSAQGQILLSAADIVGSAQIQSSNGTAEASVACRFYTDKSDKMVLQFCGYTDRSSVELTVECGGVTNVVYLNPIPTDFYIPIHDVELIRSLRFSAVPNQNCDITIEAPALIQYGDIYGVQELCLGAFQRVDYEWHEIEHKPMTLENSSQCLISKDGEYLYSISETNGSFNVYRLDKNGTSEKVTSIEHLGPVRDMAFTEDEHGILISSRAAGVWIMDVSDPNKPEILSHYSSLEFGSGICVSGQNAFVASRLFGTEIIDISDLRNPRFVSRAYKESERESENFDCFVDGKYLYVSLYMNRLLDVYDISDLKHPKLCSEIKTDGAAQGCVVRDGILYLSTALYSRNTNKSVWDYGAGTGNGLEIYDVKDPSAPQRLSVSKVKGRNNLQNYDVWDVQLSGSYAVLSNAYNGILVYDISDPYAPVCISQHEYIIKPSDSRYTRWNSELKVFPWNTEEADRGVVFHTEINNGKAYAVVRQIGVCQVDLGIDITEEEQSAAYPYTEQISLPHEISLRGYQVSAFKTDDCIWAVTERSGRVYAAAGDGGILVFDKDLNLLHQEITGTEVRDVKIYGDVLFTAEGTAGIGSFCITDDTLERLDLLALRRGASCASDIGVTADGAYLIAQLSGHTHAVIDVYNPEQMTLIDDRVDKNGSMYYRTVCNGLVAGKYVGIAGGSGSCWYTSKNGKLELTAELDDGLRQITGGFAAMGNNAVLVGDGGYRYYSIDQKTKSDLIKVSGINLQGKPSISGDRMVVASTEQGKVYILNIHNIKKPVLEASFTVDGCPDTACIADNAVYLPCRYGGLLKIETKR